MLGQTLGNYRVLSKLGEGGMGAVYLAEHTMIGRKAAIKTLLPQFTDNRELVDRFFNEAKAATAIHHPGIVEIYDFGTLEDGTAYMVMELLKGEALEARLLRLGRLPIKQAAAIVRHTASALAAAHAQGIVHRDLKPDNIFVVPDPDIDGGERVKLLDFGIAKLAETHLEEGAMKTRTGMVMGTPSYMSPEQCRGAGEVDARADVYSLGCVLFHLLCGRPPFVMEGLGELLGAHQHVAPPAAHSIEESVPAELDAFISRTLAKNPGERPQTMDEIVAALTPYVSINEAAVAATMAAPAEAATIAADAAVGATAAAPTAAIHAAPTTAAAPAIASEAAPPVTGSTVVAAEPGKEASVHQTAVVAEPAPAATQRIQEGTGKLPWAIISGVAIAAVAAAAAFVVLGGGDEEAATVKTERAAKPTAPPDKPVVAAEPSDPAPRPPQTYPKGMAWLPGGEFEMGSSDAEVDDAFAYCRTLAGDQCMRDLYARELPKRKVTVSPFFFDKREVTNDAFAAWLNRLDGAKLDQQRQVVHQGKPLAQLSKGATELVFDQGKFAAADGAGRHPVILVTWYGARAYCQAHDGDLPSEAQWAFAARGSERRRFPWGAGEPTCDKVAFGRTPGGPCESLEGLADVGTSAGDITPRRARDLGGNAAEWVLDEFNDCYADCGDCMDPIAEAAANPARPVVRAIRGGYAQGLGEAIRAAGRSRQPENAALVNLGFRCAKPHR